MSSELGYDTSRLRVLQEDVRRLNEMAMSSGLLDTRKPARAPRPAAPAEPVTGDDASPAKPGATRTAAPGRGRVAARKLIALTGRIEGDDSPAVHGTSFTEAGVVRLLARLRRRRKRRSGPWSRFLARAQRGLSRPVPLGQHTVAGISLARLQIFAGQLAQVEAKGLTYLETRRAARRGRASQTGTLMLGGRPPAVAEMPSEERSS